jgi:AmiR/NasT family two-component response regulator
MAVHAIDADDAFALLRNQSQRTGHKLVDVATSIVDSHLLLVRPGATPLDVELWQ